MDEGTEVPQIPNQDETHRVERHHVSSLGIAQRSTTDKLDSGFDQEDPVAGISFDNVSFDQENDQEKFSAVIRCANKITAAKQANQSLSSDENNSIAQTIQDNLEVIKAALVSEDRYYISHSLIEIEKANLSPGLTASVRDIQYAYARKYLHELDTSALIHDPKFNTRKAALILSRARARYDLEGRSLAESHLYTIIKELGLDPDTLLRTWVKSSEWTSDKYGNIEQNLLAAIKLELQRPGILQTLYKEFNVSVFGRYPEELLIRQYDERNDQTKQYGVILYPLSDWNSAFFINRPVFRSLFHQLEKTFSLRVIEAESKNDIGRAMINLKRRYGVAHKISFTIVGGHGAENCIQFGGPEARHLLLSSDLKGRGVQRTSEFFEPNPTVILISCSTGVEKGIGQQLSEMIGAHVIAPETPTNIESMKVTLSQDGKPIFKVKYYEENAARSYLSGKVDALYV